MVTKTAEELCQFAESILRAIGAHASGAKRVAEHMIDSNLCGVDTHGLFLLPRYVDWVRNGQMIPDAGGPFQYSGTVMIVFKADLFRPLADYAASVDDTQRRVRAVPPAEGFKEVLIPGDLENRTREVRRREGIPMDDSLWETLTEVAATLEVEVP